MDKSTDEINRLIATKVMGRPCWHDPVNKVEKYGGMRTYIATCSKCHTELGDANWEFTEKMVNPDYCTDLNATAEAERKVIEMVGKVAYFRALFPIERFNMDTNLTEQYVDLITADALTRCRAILQAVEGEG